MFVYEKKLQYPVKISTPNPKLASYIISQYGGPDGELGASLRYLSQRYSMPYPELKALLTDIGTEELGHLEMIGAIVHQLTRNLSEKQITDSGYGAYFIDHTTGVYPTAASGSPWNAASMAVKGDVIADLTEDLAAEQKARVTYDNILRVSDDPDVSSVIRFLRAREVVHFQRFGEAIALAKEKMDQKNVYFTNPAFDGSGSKAFNSNMGSNMSDNMSSNMNRSMGSNMSDNMNRSMSSNVSDNVNRSMSSNMSDNVNRSMSSNMSDSVNRSMSSNMSDNMNRSMGSNMNSNVSGNMGSITTSSMGSNVGRSMSGNVGSSMSSNTNRSMGSNVNSNVSGGTGSNMNRSMGSNVSGNMGSNVSSYIKSK